MFFTERREKMAFDKSKILPCIKNWDLISLNESGQDRAIMLEKLTGLLMDGYITNDREVTCCKVKLQGQLIKSLNDKKGKSFETGRITKIQIYYHDKTCKFENSQDLIMATDEHGNKYYLYAHEAIPEILLSIQAWSACIAKDVPKYL